MTRLTGTVSVSTTLIQGGGFKVEKYSTEVRTSSSDIAFANSIILVARMPLRSPFLKAANCRTM